MRLQNARPGEIVVSDYDPAWPELFVQEADALRSAFGAALIALEHIGSTSVPGLPAKAVIDIQAVVRTLAEAQAAAPALATFGWEQGVFDLDPERRLYFKKNTVEGVRTHQLHVYEPDHPAAADHVLFRDYLRLHSDEAARYVDLKRRLAEIYRHDRIAYSAAKDDYVAVVLAKARGSVMDEVVLAAYDPSWPEVFAGEASAIRQALGDALVEIEHVGSTAIPGLAAKPVIDVVVSVTSLAAGTAAIPALEALGYDCRGENGIPGRLFFRKGVVEFRRTHHLHLVEAGHDQWKSLLAFRDYLRSHPGDARRYEELKRALAEQFRDSRAAYSKGKADFIQAILEKARQQE